MQVMRKLHEGIIGDVLSARAWNVQRRRDIGHGTPSAPPAGLDYNTWVWAGCVKVFVLSHPISSPLEARTTMQMLRFRAGKAPGSLAEIGARRRSPARSAIAILLLLGMLVGPRLHAGEKPNIISILADDQGWHQAHCYGSDFYETPNLDRLAVAGMRFTDAYAACPVCSPTRASIMTGKYPARLHLTEHISGERKPFLDRPSWKKPMLALFRENWNNPSHGSKEWPACWFRWSAGDVDLFLDCRFYRGSRDPSALRGGLHCRIAPLRDRSC